MNPQPLDKSRKLHIYKCKPDSGLHCEVRDEDDETVLFVTERNWYGVFLGRPLLKMHRVPSADGNGSSLDEKQGSVMGKLEEKQGTQRHFGEPLGSMWVRSMSSALYMNVAGKQLFMQRAGWLSGDWKVKGPGVDWLWECVPVASFPVRLTGEGGEGLALIEPANESARKVATLTLHGSFPEEVTDMIILCGLVKLESLLWSSAADGYKPEPESRTNAAAEKKQ